MNNNGGGDYVANGMEIDHENDQMELDTHAQSAIGMRAHTEFNSPPDYGFSSASKNGIQIVNSM